MTPSRRTVARAIAAHLAAHGWRYRRGSTAPWIEPGAPADGIGWSLLGAAERQRELREVEIARLGLDQGAVVEARLRRHAGV
jgi:hypothetical protein